MPWKIEAGSQTYVIEAGENITIPAPGVIGNEEISLHADTYLGAQYLGFAEVNKGCVDKRSERYIYPVANNYKEELKKRGVTVEFI